MSLIGVKGLKSHGHAEKKPRTISARGKKCWETGSAAWYIILYCVHGTIQYTQYKLQVPSFWQSLSCLSKKISEKKKSDVRVL